MTFLDPPLSINVHATDCLDATAPEWFQSSCRAGSNVKQMAKSDDNLLIMIASF